MFKANQQHLQGNLFGFDHYLPDKQQQELLGTEEKAFYDWVFCQIKEEEFACLYSETYSRPNAPVNSLVSALILINKNNWTYEQFFKQMTFNMLIRTALGLKTFGNNPFNRATLFNFQNAIADYYLQTGVNLLERVFDHLTAKQLQELRIKTSIQRTDSFLAASNIVSYSRVRLLVEVLIRFYRILEDRDKEKLKDKFSEYISHQTAGHYVYNLSRDEVPHKLTELGKLYYYLVNSMPAKYRKQEIFKIMTRVYSEQFVKIKGKVIARDDKDITSGSLQSPDDPEATYRKKGDQTSRGYTVNLTETAHPDNQLNLITDISVEKNNEDDSKILNERLGVMKEKTPDLEELHADGAYGSSANDELMEEAGVKLVQTAVRGRKAGHLVKIDKMGDQYIVSCPHQTVIASKARKRYKACFDKSICHCVKGTFYFTEQDYLRHQRIRNLEQISPNRQKLRPNVEATVHEFKCKTRNGKLKTRGKIKAEFFAFTIGVGVNVGRIYRFLVNSPDKSPVGAVKVQEGRDTYQKIRDIWKDSKRVIIFYWQKIIQKQNLLRLAKVAF